MSDLKITKVQARFVATGPIDELCKLKKARWMLLEGRGMARTTKIERVVPFLEFCDADAHAEVKAFSDEKKEAIAASFAATVDMDIPAPPGREYRDYQKAGIAYMAARWGSLNADVPRLGKTIQAIGVVNLLPLREEPYRVLAVVPSNAKPGWVREANNWLVHDMTVGYCEGNTNPETDFLVINFELLERHFDYLTSVDWDVVISDETHKLGNPKAKRTKITFGKHLKGKRKDQKIDAAHHFLCLTGTPVFTRPKQLWPMIEKLDRYRVFGSWMNFIYKYCAAFKGPFGLDADGSSNEEELQFLLRKHFMIRREKCDVMEELPPNRQTILLPKTGLTKLLATERSAFQNNLDKLVELLDEGDESKLSSTTLEDVGEVVGKGSDARRELALRKSKMVVDFVKELLETEDKTIVFYHHREPLEKFYEAFEPHEIARVYGGMTTATREAERVRFQTDPACRVIVGNLQSMSEAIELSAADTVVFAEFARAVPSEYDQAEERPWLPTKTMPISVYRLVIEDSIEADLVEILEKRQAGIERLVNREYV
jgi:SNF2 family DNA or RNA helicase